MFETSETTNQRLKFIQTQLSQQDVNHTQTDAEKEEEQQESEIAVGAATEPGNEKEERLVVLTQKLDTHLARKVFPKAIEDGLMKVTDGHYQWLGTKVQLAYLCGRIYCGDRPVKEAKTERCLWKYGQLDYFPDTDLNALFNVKDLKQSRNNRKDALVPNNASRIDALFEDEQ
jgi:hypothetical protein